MRFSPSMAGAAEAAQQFRPLAPLLSAAGTEALAATSRRLAELSRGILLAAYGKAVDGGKRVAAFVLADALTSMGIPPCFRLDHYSIAETTVEQRFDFFLADLRWLRYWHREHARTIRYARYRTLLLAGTDTAFHREAEFVFYGGRRPAWKIAASLGLNERQQFDCVWLRSTPIRKLEDSTRALSAQVWDALEVDLRTVRLTSAFTQADANSALKRRHQIWRCSRMAFRSPTETAARYEQLTGLPISRQAAKKQSDKIDQLLHKKEIISSRKKGRTIP